MAHICNPNTWEMDARGSGVQGRTGLHETLNNNKQINLINGLVYPKMAINCSPLLILVRGNFCFVTGSYYLLIIFFLGYGVNSRLAWAIDRVITSLRKQAKLCTIHGPLTLRVASK